MRCTGGRSGQVISGQVGHSVPGPSQSFALSRQATYQSRATMVQSPGGGCDKVWVRPWPGSPAGQARGPYLGQEGSKRHPDETRRTGFLPGGPLWVRASRFVSPAGEWGRPDKRATCTATTWCKSPTDRDQKYISQNKTKHHQLHGTAQAQASFPHPLQQQQ